MKLTFLGTRGNIEPRNDRHRRHTATLVTYRGRSVLIDCGEDWAGRLGTLRPRAIVLTHAHPDHAGGLAAGAPCPVYGTRETLAAIAGFPLADTRRLAPGRTSRIAGIGFEAFTVEHSLRAPAVGYRVTAGRVAVFYVPDLVAIHRRSRALAGLRLYVGDGASLDRPLVRHRDGRRIGHTTVRRQLDWCRDEGVPRMIVTHCGSQIVAGDERRLGAKLRRMARVRGVRARIAYDGLEEVLR